MNGSDVLRPILAFGEDNFSRKPKPTPQPWSQPKIFGLGQASKLDKLGMLNVCLGLFSTRVNLI